MIETWQLRAAFARGLSERYGAEVPAYLTLVEVANAVNQEVLLARGLDAERLGGAARVGAERHGAIRLGSAEELAQAARLFAALGMHPVGYYDLRDGGVPVVSTAFRPIEASELERNPFRVFTSVLTAGDQRFFTADLSARVQRRIRERTLFSPALLDLADRAAHEGGLPDRTAEHFVRLLTDAFRLDPTPIDKAWYDELHAVSGVAADIAGCPSTHINHLTPRVLDIDELHRRMSAGGIEMIPEIQGPPAWHGPDVLLRQTSFKALAEPRRFRCSDGTVHEGQLRVRFGEVESRGIALTQRGRARYDEALAQQDRLSEAWAAAFPDTERQLLLDGLGVFTATACPDRVRDGQGPQPALDQLVADGFVSLHPIVYEDFLPRSAAGIFHSNLDGDSRLTNLREGASYDSDWFANALQCELHDPDALYAAATDRSLRDVAGRLNLPFEALDLRSSSCRLTDTSHISDSARRALEACGVDSAWLHGPGQTRTPITGDGLLPVAVTDQDGVQSAIDRAHEAFLQWRTVPAPVRGALVKHFGSLVEQHRDALADLIAIEVGKIRSEALGEVQEVIDICDFAVGLSRQIGGLTLPSERPGHRLMETWHPLGVVAVISAFNFPAAVWAWNSAIALICGNTLVWKPSELTPLTALACHTLLARAAADCGAPADLNNLALADAAAAAPLLDDPKVALVSATGSERMGAAVAPRVAGRFGRLLLELGGNNAAVVTPTADLDLAVRGITFAAAGTAGQRCTTLRRLIVHEDIADELLERLAKVFEQLPVGDPLDPATLVGPLINQQAADAMQAALSAAVADGGSVLAGGDVLGTSGAYVRPALVRMPGQTDTVRRETFAPIVYAMTYRDLAEAIRLHNDVPQGLSSSIFTRDQREAELFLAADGSDCGIANVNIGTSGAEIGGAFGGEKTTGGGRESGSDAWKAYMRRATNTINYSDDLPLAQGVSFT